MHATLFQYLPASQSVTSAVSMQTLNLFELLRSHLLADLHKTSILMLIEKHLKEEFKHRHGCHLF